MKLHGHPLSSCTRKVLVTLAEKGREADFIHVDLFTGDHKKDPHLARHPFGVIPVLEDDGFVLLESRAIIRYLDAVLPGTSLTPTDPRQSARMSQWLSVDQSYVAPHTRTLAVQRILRKHQGLPPEESAVIAAEKALSQAFAILDQTLRTTDWLAGPTFSLADISLAPYVASLPLIEATHLLADRPALTAWSKRVQSRPSWNQAVPA